MGSLLGSLAIGEIVVRAFDLGPTVFRVEGSIFRLSENPVLQYELLPGGRYRGERIGASGMRGRDAPLEKPPGVFRIGVIGDSVAFALAVDDDDSFTRRLEAMLNTGTTAERGASRFEVLNFGVPGYNTSQVVERFRRDALRYSLDVSIYLYVLNDPQSHSDEIAALTRIAKQLKERESSGSWLGMRRFASRSRLYAMATQAFASPMSDDEFWSHLGPEQTLDPGREAIANRRGIRYFDRLHRDDRRFSSVVEGLSTLGRLSRDRGVPCLIAVFPLMIYLRADDYPLKEAHDRVVQAALDSELPALDLLPLFAGATTGAAPGPAADFIHPNAAGNERLARGLLVWLHESGHLPPSTLDFEALDRRFDLRSIRTWIRDASHHP